MKSIQKIFIGIAAVASLGIANAVYAHDDSGKPPGECMHDGVMGGLHGMDGRMGGKGAANLPAMIDKRLEKIKGELKITAAQEGAWQAFAAKTKQLGEDAQAMHEKRRQAVVPATAASAPEHMEKGIESMKQHLSHMEAMLGAVKDLYAALTPEQRVIADKHFSHQSEQRRERMHRAK